MNILIEVKNCRGFRLLQWSTFIVHFIFLFVKRIYYQLVINNEALVYVVVVVVVVGASKKEDNDSKQSCKSKRSNGRGGNNVAGQRGNLRIPRYELQSILFNALMEEASSVAAAENGKDMNAKNRKDENNYTCSGVALVGGRLGPVGPVGQLGHWAMGPPRPGSGSPVASSIPKHSFRAN